MIEQKIKAKKSKDPNIFEVKMTVTLGKLLSILHALEHRNTPVGNDVLWMLRNAMSKEEIPTQ